MPPAYTAGLVLALLLPVGDAGAADLVADTVKLRDGSVVVGELLDPTARGEAAMVVRRAWAREHVPALAKRWEQAESAGIKRATKQRLTRLRAWRTLRGEPVPGVDDRITPWLDREIESLGKAGVSPDVPLMTVKLKTGEIKSIDRRPKPGKRLLRLAWTSSFRNPEAMGVEDLKLGLEGRGFDPSSSEPVSIDGLLPPRQEVEAQWLERRGATEILNDPGLRFVRHEGLVFPEPAPGQPLEAGGASLALSALKSLLDDSPDDPWKTRLRDLAGKGRSSALVTQLRISPDMSTVQVDITLWVRPGPNPDNWVSSGSRSTAVRSDQVAPDAGKAIAEDPQVKMAFQFVEGLGLGALPPEIKQRSLNVGAATQKALAQTRSAAEADLAALALPVKRAAEAPEKVEVKP